MKETRFNADIRFILRQLGELPPALPVPVLVIVSGLPGTGKTFFSRQLAAKLPFLVVESDALRKQFFPEPTYSGGESAYLFRIIRHLIKLLLKRGVPVILDATNLAEEHRARLYSIAEDAGARLVIVRTVAPAAAVRERLEYRSRYEPGNFSDADWDVYRQMQPVEEKIQRSHYVIETTQDYTETLDRIVRDIRAETGKE